MEHGTRIQLCSDGYLGGAEMISPRKGAWVGTALKLRVLLHLDTQGSQWVVSAFFSLSQWFSAPVAY